MKKIINSFLIGLLGLLLSAGIANATLTYVTNLVGSTDNVLQNKGDVGSIIYGDFNNFSERVKFCGNEDCTEIPLDIDIEALANGQATISGATDVNDGKFDYLEFLLVDELNNPLPQSVGFERAKFSIESDTALAFKLQLFSTLGGLPTSYPSIAITTNGLNKFTVFSDDPLNELINKVVISTDVTNGFSQIKQVRIGGLNTEPIPEPATMLLFGVGMAGLVGTRLRRKK